MVNVLISLVVKDEDTHHGEREGGWSGVYRGEECVCVWWGGGNEGLSPNCTMVARVMQRNDGGAGSLN